MNRACLVLALWVCAALPAASGQSRTIRLFFAPIGLSDPADVQSPALNPAPLFGVNPHWVVQPAETTRLYLWAKFEPAGTPNNATFHGVSVRASVLGAGGGLSGFNFWNYTNGSYGNGTGRWQQFSNSSDQVSATFSGAAVSTGAGVSNSNNAATNDTQHRRFAPDGVTRIDATLLGSVDFAGSEPASLLRIFLSVGNSGIAQSGQPPPRIYFGWGDEELIYVQGDDFGVTTPIPEATIFVAPEPAGLALLLLGALAFRRR